jgi:hypothetical protein
MAYRQERYDEVTARKMREEDVKSYPCTFISPCPLDEEFIQSGRRGEVACEHTSEWVHDGNHLICTKCGHDGT